MLFSCGPHLFFGALTKITNHAPKPKNEPIQNPRPCSTKTNNNTAFFWNNETPLVSTEQCKYYDFFLFYTNDLRATNFEKSGILKIFSKRVCVTKTFWYY